MTSHLPYTDEPSLPRPCPARQALMRQWSPGLTVVGTLVSDGRRKVFTIYPDGSTEEQEETAASSVFNYLRTTTTLPGGGSWHTIQLTTLEAEYTLMYPN